MAYFAAVLLRVVEDADEIVRLCPEDFRFGNVEMAARNADSFAQSSAERQLIGEARLVGFGDATDHQGRQPADLRRMEIIVAHENFHATQTAFALVAQGLADLFLMLEGQLV